MMSNSSMSVLDSFLINNAEHYRTISTGFGGCHLDPVNVALHFITTPMGMVGAFSLLYSYTQSSSVAIVISVIYLLSLLPAVPNGVFVGTAALCAIIVFLAKQWRLSFGFAVFIVICGYAIQDMAHLATGEPTFQASYSDGGQVIFVLLQSFLST